MNKRLGIGAILVAAVATTAGLLASSSSGAPRAQLTIGLIVQGPGSPTAPEEEAGAQSAAAALGDRLVVTEDASDAQTQIDTIKSLIAQHVAAIAVNTDQGEATIEQVLPALAQARAASIPTLSFEQRYPGSVWVNQSGSTQYAHALADALARQMRERGQYVIVPCQPADSIVQTWLKAAKAYIPRRYPRMHRVAVIYGGIGNGPAGTLELRPVLRKYPHLRGLIFLCPSESYTGPPQLVHTHNVGKVFSAGNGGDCPPVYITLANSVRAGSEEVVCGGDPVHLGYLTIWAADYLARHHALTLAPGPYDVGGPVGTVHYLGHNQELRLGQPLTVTKANLDQVGISR
ncbi:MAG TPA: substrate-binding domain-containing protein [Gaiellaceae bacterium]|nr:substrate-binding domain-containing protein [Gaiellaceae bacterium]